MIRFCTEIFWGYVPQNFAVIEICKEGISGSKTKFCTVTNKTEMRAKSLIWLWYSENFNNKYLNNWKKLFLKHLVYPIFFNSLRVIKWNVHWLCFRVFPTDINSNKQKQETKKNKNKNKIKILVTQMPKFGFCQKCSSRNAYHHFSRKCGQTNFYRTKFGIATNTYLKMFNSSPSIWLQICFNSQQHIAIQS